MDNAKKKKTETFDPSPLSSARTKGLVQRNKALLYTLGGFSLLLYLISFVRMGQW